MLTMISVLASRAPGCLFDTQTLKNHTLGHPVSFCDEFLEMQILKQMILKFSV